MNYRETFVNRALDVLKSYKGSLPPEVRSIVHDIGVVKDAHTLTTAEFNALQDAAERIDTQQRINQVQKTIRRSSASRVMLENKDYTFEKKPRLNNFR